MTLFYTGLLIGLSLGFSHARDIIEISYFGDNPGNIKMFAYVPESVPDNAPLVVSLHGCNQSAAIYSNAGWKHWADTWKLYVIYPEQQKDNNSATCWSWFNEDDIVNRRGEAGSILNMIDRMKDLYSIDEHRIFIEGLSAGGWMTAALLATYPDIFRGGAVIAGGPSYCGCTENNVWGVFSFCYYFFSPWVNANACMAGSIDKSPEEWKALVETYNPYHGQWPVLSVWHGTADEIVKPANEDELVQQWTALHGVDVSSGLTDGSNTLGFSHQTYRTSSGRPVIETHTISGMGHGIPIRTDHCGQTSDYILDARICAVEKIAQFWGLNQ